jgi:predicted  nucleic acid-binding Zn-ribbon protein
MIAKLRFETEEIMGRLTQTEEKIKQLNLDKKRWEVDIGSWQQELERFQKQMRDIKTNKEYDALMAEIETRKQQISRNEDLVLQAMQELEEAKPQLGECEQRLEETEKVNSQQIEGLRKQIEGVDGKIKIKQEDKKKITGQVAKPVLATYERIRKRCSPVLVSLRKKSCGACYKTFPPQKIQEIKRGNGLVTCDSCGRILYWTEDEGA